MWEGRRREAPPYPDVCRAWHVTWGVQFDRLTVNKSPRQVKEKPKGSGRATASSRGGVGRKSNAKARGDEQEPDTRCGTLGASGHVTAKPSILHLGVLYKFGVCVRKVTSLTPGGLPGCAKSTGRRETGVERSAGVSRGRSRRIAGEASEAPQSRKARERIGRAATLPPKARTVDGRIRGGKA